MNKLGIGIIALALLACVFGIMRRAEDPFDVSDLLAHKSAPAAWSDIMSEALKRVTRGTLFAARWQIDKPPRKGWLSVILVDSDALPASALGPALRRNCTFTGSLDLIICDVALIRRFLAARDLDKMAVGPPGDRPVGAMMQIVPLSADQLRHVQFQMMEWILGHEIGHIFNGDSQAHFGEDRLDANVQPATLVQARELAADGFLAREFPQGNGGPDMDFYLFLIGILQHEINGKACPDRSPLQECPNIQTGVLIFSPNDYLRFSRKGSHPEYIIRMIRLLSEADQQHGIGIVGPLVREVKAKLLAEDQPHY